MCASCNRDSLVVALVGRSLRYSRVILWKLGSKRNVDLGGKGLGSFCDENGYCIRTDKWASRIGTLIEID